MQTNSAFATFWNHLELNQLWEEMTLDERRILEVKFAPFSMYITIKPTPRQEQFVKLIGHEWNDLGYLAWAWKGK